MKAFERWFIALVIVADLTAVMYFGGNFLLHGSLTAPKQEVHDTVVADASHAEAAKPKAPAFDPTTYEPNIAKGQKLSGKCKACHTFGEGEANRIGPNLWNIADAPIAAKDGFAYSAAFTAKAGEIVWNDTAMDALIKKPGKFIPGTKMAFPGIKKPQDRADLIAWLKTLK